MDGEVCGKGLLLIQPSLILVSACPVSHNSLDMGFFFQNLSVCLSVSVSLCLSLSPPPPPLPLPRRASLLTNNIHSHTLSLFHANLLALSYLIRQILIADDQRGNERDRVAVESGACGECCS